MTTAASPLLAVQIALYQKLSGDSTLVGLVTGVYDNVPEDAVYPYVVIGEVNATPDNAHGLFGRELLATIHVWSNYRGFREALQITEQIVTLLDHQPLAVTGHRVVSVRHDRTFTLREFDPEVRHVPVRMRIITSQE